MAIKLLRAESYSHQQVISALDRLSQAVKSYPDSAHAFSVLGRLHIKVNDDLGAETYLKQAIQLAKDHPTPRIIYQQYLLQRERPDEALTISESLIDEGWGGEPKSDEFTSRRIWSSHFRCLIENGLYDRVIEIAPSANSNKSLQDLGRCATAHAIIYKAQPLHSDDPASAIASLSKAAKHLIERPGHERIRSQWSRVFRSLCKELNHLFDVNESYRFDSVSIEIPLRCIAQHAPEVYENFGLHVVRTELVPSLRFLKKHASSAEAKLLESNWFNTLLNDQPRYASQAKALTDQGFKMLTIYKVPYTQDNIPGFLFAEDPQGQRYFVQKNACRNFEHVAWAQLRVGSRVAGRNFSVPNTQKDYPSPSDVMLLI